MWLIALYKYKKKMWNILALELQVINKIYNFVKHLKLRAMKEEDLIVLKEHDSVNNAEWERSLLEGAGIWAMVRNEIMSAIYPTSAFPAQLVVRKEDKEKALEIIDAYWSE